MIKLPDNAHILIVKLGAIGDVIHALPAAIALKKAYPKSELTWLVENKAADIVINHPAVDHWIIFNRQQKNIREVVRAIRKRKFDAVIDFQGTYKSGFFVALSKAVHKIGYRTTKEPVSFLYGEKVPLNTWDRHAVDRNLDLAEYVGAPRPSEVTFQINASEQEKQGVSQYFEQYQLQSKQFIAMNVTASRPANRWGLENFKGLCRQLEEEYPHLPIILTGSKHDFELNQEVAKACTAAVNFAGLLSLKQFAYLLTQAKLMVCLDTGPMHVAVASECPVVVVFGASNPLRTGPYQGKRKMIAKQLECQPCYKKICPLKHYKCLKELDVETVFAEVKNMLT